KGVAEVRQGLFHACARFAADGTLKCWGDNEYGAIGDGTTAKATIPTPVTGIANAVQLSLGGGGSSARLADGTIRIWGAAFVGDGTDGANPLTPVVGAGGVSDVVDISLGLLASCMRRSSKAGLWCWGENDDGRLGIGKISSRELSPMEVVW
ncbi:MAG: RCC1 domain-containing protein, partial [Polyangiales bacterium]